MAVVLAPREHADLVGRLRAAGCVFAEDEARLLLAEAETPAGLAAMVERRAAGLPLEHVVGWAEFCGLRIPVQPGTFVPRRRTEFLVGQAATLVRRRSVVVDLCCGSGAVGVALLAEEGSIELHAVEVDPVAARCARHNLRSSGRVYEGDLYEPLPSSLRSRVNVLVANAPYVPSGALALLPPEARSYEPRVALDGGIDGLDVLRAVVTGAPSWLARGGHLLVETSADQAPTLCADFAANGLAPRVVGSAELGATVVIGGVADRAQREAVAGSG